MAACFVALLVAVLAPTITLAQNVAPAPLAGHTALAPGQPPAPPPDKGGAGQPGQGQPSPPAVPPQAPGILLEMFVLAVLLESALALIFNWRPFIYFFDSRGVKTVVSLLVAALLINAVEFNGVGELLLAYNPALSPNALKDPLTYFLTAVIFAGGSSGVNNIFVALGLRSKPDPQAVTPKPPPTEAWLSVRLVRRHAKGVVLVQLGLTPAPGVALPTAGFISGAWSPPGLLRFFVRDQTRFPTAGGYVVQPGVPITLQLEGADKDNPLQRRASLPLTESYAPGAIVDYVVEL